MPRDCTELGHFTLMNSPNNIWDPIQIYMSSGYNYGQFIASSRPERIASSIRTVYSADGLLQTAGAVAGIASVFAPPLEPILYGVAAITAAKQVYEFFK